MCGIVGYIGTKRAVPILIDGLLSLEYRGYDSAGLAVLSAANNSTLQHNVTASKYSISASQHNTPSSQSHSSTLQLDNSKFKTKPNNSKFETKPNNSKFETKPDNSKFETKIEIFKNQGRVHSLMDNFDLDKITSTIGIAHTRWATHGVPSPQNSHPHWDNSHTFAVVHNGIIENYENLRKFLYSEGYTLYSQTDTEVIPNLIHYYYTKLTTDNEFKQAMLLTFSHSSPIHDEILLALACTLKQLEGSYALEIITPLRPNQIYVAKKDSPMVIGAGSDENFIASDIPAILQHTKKFYFMNDNELAVISRNEIDFYDSSLHSLTKEIKDIDWDAEASEKGEFEDYMLKEIYEQPTALRETIGTSIVDGKVVFPELDDIDFSHFTKTYIVACGTAMHSGLATKATFESLTHIPTIVDAASEFRYRDPLIDDKTLCIFVSQSGETADTLAALKLAKHHGATTISIVNVVGSSITRFSDYTLYTHAGPEIAVASTKAFTCQVAVITLLAMYASKDFKLTNELSSLPNKIKKVLECAEEVKKLATELSRHNDIYFTGRGYDSAVATEGALKLKEISYIHADAYPSGEFKHGPIALISKGVPVIGIATNPEINAKTLSNLLELITRGANVLLITNANEINDEIQNIIKLPDASPLISSILAIIPLQLLAYYVAKAKGLDVDKPRNLAKSVTVE